MSTSCNGTVEYLEIYFKTDAFFKLALNCKVAFRFVIKFFFLHQKYAITNLGLDFFFMLGEADGISSRQYSPPPSLGVPLPYFEP